MDDPIGPAFLAESVQRIGRAREGIHHSLEQIRDDDFWWTPVNGVNSAGTIIQHLAGNLRQWITSGVGGAPDTRDRPAEFVAAPQAPKATVWSRLTNTLDEVTAVLTNLPPEALLETRRIQGFDRSVMSAIYSAVTHLELHAGQIAYLARMRVGEGYREFWKPANKEQGA